MAWTVVDSPIGELGIGVDDDVVTGVSFGRPRDAPVEELGGPVVARARVELAEYFAGERVAFDVPFRLTGGSRFERAVWEQIAGIPYGETLSYGAIARAVGEPGGAQAVGTACHHNPLPLVVACHRVIGSDGKLVGFGGGLSRKRFLLQLEARIHIERTMAP